MSKNRKPNKKLSRPVTVLLTGFDAFGGDQRNPSQIVVESFPDLLKIKARGRGKATTKIHICKQVLPTAGKRGWKILRKALDSAVNQAEGLVILLMLGLAAARSSLSLERFALNFSDYSLADNDGQKRLEESIERHTPSLLSSNLDLRRLQAKVSSAGYPCDISNHAGTFVCNELYFRALSYKRKFKTIDSVLFVHLPLEKTFAQAAREAQNKRKFSSRGKALKDITADGKAAPIELLQQAIAAVTRNVTRQIARRPV